MAKKPSPADLKAKGEALAVQFAAVRKAQHFFSLQIGKSGLILKTHRRRPPEVLWRQGKKEGGGNKGAKGVANMSGKVMELQCDDLGSVPSTLVKMAKAEWAEAGQPARINLVEMSAEALAEIEGAGGDEEGENTEATETSTEDTGATQETATSEAADGGGGGEEPSADGGQEAAAEDTAQSPEEDLLTSLRREYDELQTKIVAAGDSANKGFAKKVSGLNTMFESQIEGNTKKARAVLGLLQTTIQTGLDAGDMAEPAEQNAPVDMAAAAESRRGRMADLEKSVDDLLAQFAAG